jgi:hypothetical protein
MFRIIAWDWSHVTNCMHFDQALRLMRAIPRAAQVWTDDCETLLAWKPRNNLEAVAMVGVEAGSPVDPGRWVSGWAN